MYTETAVGKKCDRTKKYFTTDIRPLTLSTTIQTSKSLSKIKEIEKVELSLLVHTITSENKDSLLFLSDQIKTNIPMAK